MIQNYIAPPSHRLGKWPTHSHALGRIVGYEIHLLYFQFKQGLCLYPLSPCCHFFGAGVRQEHAGRYTCTCSSGWWKKKVALESGLDRLRNPQQIWTNPQEMANTHTRSLTPRVQWRSQSGTKGQMCWMVLSWQSNMHKSQTAILFTLAEESFFLFEPFKTHMF